MMLLISISELWQGILGFIKVIFWIIIIAVVVAIIAFFVSMVKGAKQQHNKKRQEEAFKNTLPNKYKNFTEEQLKEIHRLVYRYTDANKLKTQTENKLRYPHGGYDEECKLNNFIYHQKSIMNNSLKELNQKYNITLNPSTSQAELSYLNTVTGEFYY